MQITIVIKGDKEFIGKMRKLDRNMLNHRTAMKNIGKKLKRYYGDKAFDSQGGEFGEVWPDLKKSTVDSRIRRAGGAAAGVGAREPLVVTGKMKRSFHYKNTKDSVTISNRADYFKYHQSALPRRRLPRRQMIGINDKVRRLVRQEIRNSVKRKLQEV